MSAVYAQQQTSLKGTRPRVQRSAIAEELGAGLIKEGIGFLVMNTANGQRSSLPQGATVNGQGYGTVVMFGVIGRAQPILRIDRFIEAGETQDLGDLGNASQGFPQGPIGADRRGVNRGG